jgi:hypothetical protein
MNRESRPPPATGHRGQGTARRTTRCAEYSTCPLCQRVHPDQRVGLCRVCIRWGAHYGPAIRQIAKMLGANGRLPRGAP